MDLDSPIVWVDEFAIGIPLVDAQHRRLVEMVETLRQAVVEGAQTATATKILKGLISYCAEHFECEEMVMENVNYPALPGHSNIHREFTDKVLQWFGEFQKGQLDPAIVLEALVQWLVNHILNQDAKIFTHCREHGIDTSKIVSVSDLIPPEKSDWLSKIPVELGLLPFVLPMLGIMCWLTFGLHASLGSDIVYYCIGLGINVAISMAMVYYVRHTVHRQIRGLQLAHARQLADNMLASDIAQRVAVLDLENLDALFSNESSSLVMALQEIVTHVKLYLPFIPDTVLAMIRGEAGDEGDEDQEQRNSLPSCDSRNTMEVLSSGAGGGARSAKGPSYPDLNVLSNTGVVTTSSADDLDSSTPLSKKRSGKYAMNANKRVPSRPSLAGGELESDEGRTSNTAILGLPDSKPIKSPSTSSMKYERLEKPVAGNTLSVVAGNPDMRKASRASGFSVKSSLAAKDRRTSKASMASTVRGTASKMKHLGTTWLMKKTVSTMVTDITGFNHLATIVSVDELLKLHTAYVGIVNDLGKATRGRVNAMMGDRIFLSWNAASACGNYAQQSCKAALQLKDIFHKDPTLKSVKCKIAVATGTALVGNVGSKSNLGFAIIGPVSIISSALCKLNCKTGTDVLICSNTYRNAKQFYIAKIVGRFDLWCSPVSLLASMATHPLPAPSIVMMSPEEGDDAAEAVLTDLEVSSPNSKDADVKSPDEAQPRQSLLSEWAEGVQYNNGELRRMVAMNLVAAIGAAAEDEWMYQLQSAANPFEGYNEALMMLLYGDFAKGLQTLKEYVQANAKDVFAGKILREFDAHSNAKGHPGSVCKWTYGWH